MTTTPTSPSVRLCSPADVLAATPYLLGFHPSESLVILGIRGRGLRFHVRGDLPDDRADGEVLAESYAGLFKHHRVEGVVLIGYGTAERAEPLLSATREAMRIRGIEIQDVLRAHEGRYWSLECGSPECCPPEGRPYDPVTSAVAVEATFAGMVALPDRNAVVRSLDGPTGPELVAIEDAADRASLRLVRQVTGRNVRKAVLEAGVAALDEAVTRYADGQRLTDDEVAWLVTLLHVVAFRDRAWKRIDGDGEEGRRVHLALWADLVRRSEPALAAPVAVLLAYVCWRAGDGLRASIAVDRALDADPVYSAARLMAEILDRAIPPSDLPPASLSGAHGRPRPARRRRAARRRKY